MSDEIETLLERNRAWAEQVERDDPGFFSRLSNQQSPRYLWIGCSDSRVPANQITGLMPGEVFVHRNVANVVHQTDINCMSVVQFAIRQLKVRHVIVCGHYGCAGVQAAMEDSTHGIVDHWLCGIRDLYADSREELSRLDEVNARKRLCELNVVSQVKSLCRTSVIQEAWEQGQALDVHGWIYGVEDGLLRDLGVHLKGSGDLASL